ncbi:calcium-binding protein [uncultured Roseobacter sp.]|uniref:calcium-binding protein n=1 Tax=uncultured Roseobacter sp. TaxID=114847 RepID=UPI002612ABF6|nr:calcium-binding protein [uncultured Roseobacter sp.]
MTSTPEISTGAFVSNTTSGATNPKTVTLSDGRLLVTYATFVGGGPGFDVRGQLFTKDGEKIGDELLFGFSRFIDERAFDITAIEGNRVAIIVETQKGSDDIEIDSRLFRVNETSVTLVDAGTASSVQGIARNSIFSPTITEGIGNEDDYRIFFGQQRAGIESIQVGGLKNGVDTSNERLTFFKGNVDAELVSATARDGRTILVMDRDGNDGRDDDGLLFVSFNGTRERNIGNSDAVVVDPAVASLKSGSFVVAWTERDRGADIKFQIFSTDGRIASNEFTTGLQTSGDNNSEPAIAPLEDGGFIIFYDRIGSIKDREKPQVRGQRFDSEGNEVGEDFLVARDKALEIEATLIDGGRVAVAYDIAGGTTKTVIIDSQPEVDFGTIGNDVINGTNAADVIFGLLGDDRLSGGSGNDTILGGQGDDTLFGRNGKDTLNGGDGDDTIFGNAGDDILRGDDGDDEIFGADGDDIIEGGSGRDKLTGGGGADTFVISNDEEEIDILDFRFNDRIHFRDLQPDVSFAQLLVNNVTQVGRDVVINDVGDTNVIIRNVDIEDLSEEDFLFG